MHERLFESARALGPVQLPDHAKAVGLDITEFTDCLNRGKYTDEVKHDMADGRAAGVSGTPTLFLAVAGDKSGTLKTLKRIVGVQPFDTFKTAIDEALSDLSTVAKGEGGLRQQKKQLAAACFGSCQPEQKSISLSPEASAGVMHR